ncbi:MAG: leucine--tRNA ligase, partial [Chitinivibrionales bacterium]
MAPYVFSEIESKWQDRWNKAGLFRAGNREGCDKRYILCMFPYPSGNLHMGHVINYTIGDVVARYNMMKGYDVMVPMGWDSFGLPAENAAIRENIHPSENIRTNIEKMKKQMDSAGWGFDWERELATSSPDYYKWTQWLFLKFYKKGLAEQRKAPVNWCPNDQTVLANEQVYDGKCERCGTEVEQRDLTQWFFSMSEYAEKLLEGHKRLKRWPEKVLKMQKEWIGKSEGAEVDFRLEGTGEKISVYTTRPDTLFGVTFMSIAPQHPIIERLVSDNPDKKEILSAVNRMRSQGTSEREMVNRKKEGVFTGKYVINPVNGERVPLWIANFVLMEYGTGIIMAVPTHDERDFEFAQEYGIPLKVVIKPEDRELKPDEMDRAYTDDGVMVNSGEFSGKNNRDAMGEIIEWLEEKGIGKKVVNYKLKDWLISRQRYWGVPIPVVHCSKCGCVPVPQEELPVLLPDDVEFRP